MNLTHKKILITGGHGFIGSNLTKHLEKKKAIVDIYDKKEGNDVQDVDNLKRYVKKNYFAIYHLAGFSGSAKSNEQKTECFRQNTFSSANLCELITKYSPNTKLILSGSRLEYGVPRYLPIDESHPTLPNSIYGLSKLAATQTGLIYFKKNNLDITIFRTSNVYGPHPSTSFAGYNVINFFIDRAVKNQELKIYGDGEQLRDYIYIDDLVEVFTKVLKTSTLGNIYNLGYGRGIKFKDMVAKIIKIVGKGKLTYEKWPDDYTEVETGSYVTDISKIKKDLKFIPRTSFEKGIEKTARNYS